MSERVPGDAVALERRGLLVRDLESSHLTRAPGEDAAVEILQGHSITYRIAVAPHEGRKAFTLQTVPPTERPAKPFVASHAGRAPPGHDLGPAPEARV